MLRRLLIAVAALGVLAPVQTVAQTIYPLDRAEILAGAKFDFKVEFPDAPAEGAVTVRINGRPAPELLGKAASFIVKEDGGPLSAYWIRGAAIATPGQYEIEAQNGNRKAIVRWEVFGTPPAKARNVILFIGDGLSMAHRTSARILSKGMKQGRYGGELAIDDMPHMALVSTAGMDSIITDSANSMAAYTTGHKSCVSAIGVYCAANKSVLDHPKFENFAELARRRREMAVGIVTTTELGDATPAGMVAHIQQRWQYDDIIRMLHEARPEVVMGGGSLYFLPKAKPGSKRSDDVDYVAKFHDAGYRIVTTDRDMKDAAANTGTERLLGLFNTGNMDGALDRRILKKGTVARFPEQPDLVDQTLAALRLLARNDKGFVLMVESGLIDKFSHALDWERAVYDTILLDNAVKAAKDWAAPRNDTLIIVVADHGHPVSLVGTYDDDRPGHLLRDKLGVYGDAKFPNYPPADKDGYPPSVDVSRRLAFMFSAYPDHCDAGKPYLDGANVPTTQKSRDSAAVVNERNCTQPLAARRLGNLPPETGLGVHSGDDVVLTATGPGAEQFHGRIDNTRVFRAIVTALGLGENRRAD